MRLTYVRMWVCSLFFCGVYCIKKKEVPWQKKKNSFQKDDYVRMRLEACFVMLVVAPNQRQSTHTVD